MIDWWTRRSVRARLALWHTAILAMVLAAFALAVIVFVRHVLSDELSDQLHDDFEAAEEKLEAGPAGGRRSCSKRTSEEPAEARPLSVSIQACGCSAISLRR